MHPWLLLPCLAAPAQPSPFSGTWALVSAPDMPALIAAATANLRPADRVEARERLTANNPIHRELTLRADPRLVTLAWEGQSAMRMPMGGRAVPWTGPDGRKDLVSARLEGSDLVQTLLGEDGMRTCVFRLENGLLQVRVR